MCLKYDVDNNVGVKIKKSHNVKEINGEYFYE